MINLLYEFSILSNAESILSTIYSGFNVGILSKIIPGTLGFESAILPKSLSNVTIILDSLIAI